MTRCLTKLISFLLTTAMIPQAAVASWTLDNHNSSIKFVTIKNNSIAEVQQFKGLSGFVNDNGQVMVDIDLATIDTKIEVRDQRMKDMLFQIENYSEANIFSLLNIEQIENLNPGNSTIIPVEFELSLHDKIHKIDTSLSVIALADSSLQVTTIEPIIINAEQFDLVNGIQKLQQIAKLKSIALEVPVTAQLVFTPE